MGVGHMNQAYGWYWVPGYEWAPAWVAWRNNNDYYGWAPLSPGLNVSVGIVGLHIPFLMTGGYLHRIDILQVLYVSRYYVPRTQ